MKKKFYSFLSVCLGGGVVALSFFFEKSLGSWFYILMCLGVVCFTASFIEFVNLTKRPSKRRSINEKELSNIKEKPDYRRKKSILSGAEIRLFNTLQRFFGEKYMIVPQPALHTVIDKLTQNAYRNELFRVCDFLFVDKNSFAPLLLIELNDSSHNRMDRIERDQKVNEICALAKMPLLTISTKDLNDENLIKKAVQKSILRR